MSCLYFLLFVSEKADKMIVWLSLLRRLIFRFFIDEVLSGRASLFCCLCSGVFHLGLIPSRGFLCISEVSEQRYWFLKLSGKERQTVVM